jgi:hypothetical protein
VKREKRMKNLQLRASILPVAIMTLVLGLTAHAQATRTWISGVGDDANPCSRTAPCKTFAGAISKTTAGGEIDCMDPGGFGALTITKAITIDCNSGVGSALVSGTNGMVVNAGPNDVVYLKNINFNGISGAGSGSLNGVQFLAGKALILRNVDIFGFTQSCVDAETGGTSATLTIEGSTLTNCATGVNIATTGAALLNATIHNVHIGLTTTGVDAGNGSRVNIRDSVISGATTGIKEETGTPVVTLTGSTVAFTSTAIQSVTGGYVAVSGNSFTDNSTIVLSTNGGTIVSGGDNLTFGNGSLGAASGPVGKI